MAEKKEQETPAPAEKPKDEVKSARQQEKPKQDGKKTVRVLVLKKCEHDGKPLDVLRKYDLPEKAALKLVPEGKAKILA